MPDETTTTPPPTEGKMPAPKEEKKKVGKPKADKPKAEPSQDNPTPEATPAAEVVQTPTVTAPRTRPLDDRDVRF